MENLNQDYAGKVDSYICQHHDVLGDELAESMRKTLQGEIPLTKADADNWICSINSHVTYRKQTRLRTPRKPL